MQQLLDSMTQLLPFAIDAELGLLLAASGLVTIMVWAGLLVGGNREI